MRSDAASPFVSSAEKTSTDRGRDSENENAAGDRTSLGDGVVKPLWGRLDWAQLLRHTYLVDVLLYPCGGRRDISDREVVVVPPPRPGLW